MGVTVRKRSDDNHGWHDNHFMIFFIVEENEDANETKDKKEVEMEDPVCITLEYYRYPKIPDLSIFALFTQIKSYTQN